MAESKNDLTENKKKRPNKLTNARIKKEIEFLEKMFVGVDDENMPHRVACLPQGGVSRRVIFHTGMRRI